METLMIIILHYCSCFPFSKLFSKTFYFNNIDRQYSIVCIIPIPNQNV